MFRFFTKNFIIFFLLLQVSALQQVKSQVIYSNGFEGAAIAGTTSFTGGATGDPNLNIAGSTWSTTGIYTTFTGTTPTPPTSMALQPATAASTAWTLNIPVNASYMANITALQFNYRSTSTSYNSLSITINGTLVYSNPALNTTSTWVLVPVTPLSITGITGNISMVCVMSGGTHGGASTFRFDNVNLYGNVVNADNPPSFAGGHFQSMNVCENSAATSINSLMAINDIDVGQTETWTILSAPGNGVLSGFSTTALSTGGTVMPSGLSYTPNPGFSGGDAFRIQVSDGTLNDTTTVNVTVNPLPSAISGITDICAGLTVNLTDALSGGTWISSNTVVADIGSVSGTVSAYTAGTSTITYTASTGCSITTVITVNPLPTAIIGIANVCSGSTTSLTDAAAGGTWSSSNMAVGTVSPAGVVAGIAAGTTAITYTMPGNCYTTMVVTVNAMPTAILGTASICAGSVTSLSDAVSGGTWSTTAGTGSVSVVGGIVTGLTAGTANVTYTMPGNCYQTLIVTVNASPAVIFGTASVCAGSTTSLSDATPGGTWGSSNIAVGTVGSIGIVNGIAAGTTNITYTMPGNCYVTTIVTVNAMPTGILGNASVCQGATTSLSDAISGGVWSASAGTGSISVVGGLVTGVSAGTANVTYTMPGNCYQTEVVTVNASPSAILGIANVCVGLTTPLSNVVTGGTWSSSSTGVATIGSITGIVTGVGIGGTSVVTYTMPGNCYITTVVTVNPAPSAINGTLTVCQGSTTMLTDFVTGGTWSSSNISVGTANVSTGMVTGLSGGTTMISYTSANCPPVTAVVTVNPVSPILGNTTVCSGTTMVLSNVITGGTWTSGNMAVATIGTSSGVVTGGVTAGISLITYTFTTGCTASVVVTVTASPVAVSGATTLCNANVTTFSDGTTGGAWTSSNLAVGSIIATSGIFTATGAGTTTITYTLPAGCTATTTVTVNALPSMISGTFMLCAGLTTTLTDVVLSGTWTSATTSVATIGSATGLVLGITAGTTIISYTLATGCSAVATMTVDVSPVAISGNHSLCAGTTTTLTDFSAGGTWVSSNTLVASIGSASGVVSGWVSGTSTITYTLAAGCTSTTTITVNPLPLPISGTSSGCIGSTTTLSDATVGGTWSSSTGVVSMGSASGILVALSGGSAIISYILSTGCYASMVFTVNPSPVPISGTSNICQGLTAAFTDATTGGTWNCSNTNAIVGSVSGIVQGINPGVSIITYTLPTSCYGVYEVTINPAPTAISGPSAVCVNSTVSLSDGTSGGVWSVAGSSGAASISAAGVVTGLTSGIVIVSYTTFTCNPVTYSLIVDPLPDPIMGIGNLCVGSSTTFSDASLGGIWSSSNPGATISSTGIVSGVDTGSGTNITYTLPTGCFVSVPVIIFPIPKPIIGTDSVCPGSSVFLSDSTLGGVWSSSDGTIDTCFAFSGEVKGIRAGSVMVSYTLISGCYVTMHFTVENPLPATLSMTQFPTPLICDGDAVTFTAVSTNGGTPTYTWMKFGTIPLQSGPSATYTYNAHHGDYITCIMTTGNICASPAVVQTSEVVNIYPQVAPAIAISTLAPNDTAAYLGDVFTFYSNVTNGGIGPTYQWYINRMAVPGATNNTFTIDIYNENDTVYCVVNGIPPCDLSTVGTNSNMIIIYGLGYLSANSLTIANNDLSLYPNPNTGTFTLSGTLATSSNREVSLEVVDMLGRLVYTGKAFPENKEIYADIKLGDAAAGTYLLRIYTETATETFHFVIAK